MEVQSICKALLGAHQLVRVCPMACFVLNIPARCIHRTSYIECLIAGLIILPLISKAECVRLLKGLALPRFGKIALAGSRRLRPTLAAAPVLFAHAAFTEINIGRIINPT